MIVEVYVLRYLSCLCFTDYFDKIGAPDEIEKDMLEFDDLTTAHSRLSCQLPVNEVLDGVVLKVAK